MKKNIISEDELYNIWVEYDLLSKVSNILAKKIFLINALTLKRLKTTMVFRYHFNLCDIECVAKDYGLKFIDLYHQLQDNIEPAKIHITLIKIKDLQEEFYKWDEECPLNECNDATYIEANIINIAAGYGGDYSAIEDYNEGYKDRLWVKENKIKYSKPKYRLSEEDEKELLDNWNETGSFRELLDNLKILSDQIIKNIYMSNAFSKKSKIFIIDTFKKYYEKLTFVKEMDVSVLFNTICDLYVFMEKNIPRELCYDSLVSIAKMFNYKQRDVFDNMEIYRQNIVDVMNARRSGAIHK